MTTLHASAPAVQPVSDDPWADTDGFTWELGPDPDDAAWWSSQNVDFDAADAPGPDHDDRFAESEAVDAHERGVCLC